MCQQESNKEMYVNEAIVKEEAEEGRAHPSLVLNGRMHDGFDSVEETRARFRVKISGELS